MAKIHQKTIVRSDKQVLHLASGLENGAGALHRYLRQRLAEDGWDMPEEAKPRVWNVFQRIKTLPHRMRNPGKPAEITDSEEKAA